MKTKLELLFLLLILFLECTSGKQPLKCYHCWWSHLEEEVTSSELEVEKDLPYPVAKRFVGGEHPPTEGEMKKLCLKETCKAKANSYCLKWSYISGSPINITYKCVVNPKRKSGCYQQEIKTKEFKQYVKVEACLCDNKDFCNRSAPVAWNARLLASLALLVLLLGR